MLISSALCRAQEAHQHRRAAESPLANVKASAARAAVAWGVEALSAERRERRQSKATPEDEAAPIDHEASENPDRGRAHG